eukprot:m.150270 g.150270  ORF g.150270 m.150270 type:complete len:537 (+) comp11681_c0_seq1:2181-3791(+)
MSASSAAAHRHGHVGHPPTHDINQSESLTAQHRSPFGHAMRSTHHSGPTPSTNHSRSPQQTHGARAHHGPHSAPTSPRHNTPSGAQGPNTSMTLTTAGGNTRSAATAPSIPPHANGTGSHTTPSWRSPCLSSRSRLMMSTVGAMAIVGVLLTVTWSTDSSMTTFGTPGGTRHWWLVTGTTDKLSTIGVMPSRSRSKSESEGLLAGQDETGFQVNVDRRDVSVGGSQDRGVAGVAQGVDVIARAVEKRERQLELQDDNGALTPHNTINKMPLAPGLSAKDVDGQPDASSFPQGIWPRPVVYNNWRARRPFDRQQAIKELNYPAESTGGLNRIDRDILARRYFEASSVFEIGLGESTKIAIFTGVPRYVGVDGALEWIGVASQGAPAHYRFHWADVGPVEMWSKPQDPQAAPKFPMYSIGALASETSGFDFYMVDGRFRVASACACFLHASRTGRQPSDFVVAVHDFKFRVAEYGDVLKLGTVIEGFDPAIMNVTDVEGPAEDAYLDKQPRIAILRRRTDVTDVEILAIWKLHAYDIT